jgi:hypothetical protein
MPTIFDMPNLQGSNNRYAEEGVYGGQNIAMSPKYNTNNKSLDSMARMFVPLPNAAVREIYLDSIGKAGSEQAEARRIAEVIATAEGSFGNGSPGGSGYIDFLMTQAQESYTEKVQISEVLSDNFISYFFGAAPPVFNYTGVLYNTLQNDWRSAFSILYHQVIRGTQLARRKVSLCLAYDNVIVTGAILNMNQSLDATQQMAATFSFSMLVKQYYVWRPANSPITNAYPATGFLSKKATQNMMAGLGNVVSVSSTQLPASQITIGGAPRSTEPTAQETTGTPDASIPKPPGDKTELDYIGGSLNDLLKFAGIAYHPPPTKSPSLVFDADEKLVLGSTTPP